MKPAKSLSERIREKKKAAKESQSEVEPMENMDDQELSAAPADEAEVEPMAEAPADDSKKKRMDRLRAKMAKPAK